MTSNDGVRVTVESVILAFVVVFVFAMGVVALLAVLVVL
jgi:hypothetical protein